MRRSLVCTRSFIQGEFRTRLLITLNSGSTKLSHEKKKNTKKEKKIPRKQSLWVCIFVYCCRQWWLEIPPLLVRCWHLICLETGTTQKFRTRVDVRSTTKRTRWAKRCMSCPRRAEHAHAVLRHDLYFHKRCMIGTVQTNKQKTMYIVPARILIWCLMPMVGCLVWFLIFPVIVFYFLNVCEYINMYYWWWRVVVQSTRMKFFFIYMKCF